ncbi:unnamed protein product, partial [Sphacelaria rigidula]
KDELCPSCDPSSYVRYRCVHCGMKYQTFCELLVPVSEDASLAERKLRLCLVCEDEPGRQKRKGDRTDGVGGGGNPKKKGKKSSQAG